MDKTKKINDFIKSSMQLIDETDITREMSSVQAKYGAKLFRNDLEINNIECQIDNIVNKTSKLNSDIDNKADKIKLIQESLNQIK